MFDTPLYANRNVRTKAIWLGQLGALERKPKTLSLSSKEFEAAIVFVGIPSESLSSNLIFFP